MQELIVCKSCGYVMDKAGLKDKCPACGVLAKMFEPYTDKVSESRRKILKLDLHPILVHFVQAFSATIPVLCLISLSGMPWAQVQAAEAVTVLAVALPFAVVLSFLAGMLDGKVRFRRVTTPLLKTKMVLGAVLFLLSCGTMAVALLHPSPAVILALSAPAAACASYLGLLGVRMINSAFPG